MVFTLLGIALCSIVFIQIAMWTAHSFAHLTHNRRQFAASQELFRKQIREAARPSVTDARLNQDGSWLGFRQFLVSRVEKETEWCTSVYLKPVDGKPISGFKPGQHLTFRFTIPGHEKPIIRCYSLSNGPENDEYRISVKMAPAPADQPGVPEGLVSNYINRSLKVGDPLDVKSPSGAFYLNDDSNAPVVLLGGGIGITPMVSMIDHIVQSRLSRPVLLLYGVRNGRDHAFASYLRDVSRRHENIHVVNCFSDPDDGADVFNVDYHLSGFVSVDVLKQVLPTNQCEYYLCGPPPFMQSIFKGLLEWEVPESRIHYEAFGPATLKKTAASNPTSSDDVDASGVTPVVFAASSRTLQWSSAEESLLELAESNEIEMESGCRAGSCGMCAVRLLSGKVKYPDGVVPICESDECLACIATPVGAIEVDA